MPTATRLDLPEQIAKIYDEKYGEAMDKNRAKTIAELRDSAAAAAAAPLVDAVGEKMQTNSVETDTISDKNVQGDKAKSSGHVAEMQVNGANGDEDEEDLDAWLDSVI